jgi:DNA-directed RNA polymerase subunit H (RpoH/RPB5)
MCMEWYKAPVHIPLSDSMAKRELKAIGVSIDELPHLKLADAAVQKLIESGHPIKIGDVIRIERNSSTAGEGYRYYRKITR